MSIINPSSQNYIKGLHPRGKPRTMGSIESFIISAIAPAIAVLFTNPFDTAKVRLQLQGQLSAGVRYKNSFDALQKIMANEGISGLQKGLIPAIMREASKNFFRIGMFDPIMNVIHDPKSGRAPGWKRVVAGSLCGVMGAVSANPFELVKTRLQSSALGLNVVGHQHGYTGVLSGLKRIYVLEGFKGLYRGSLLSMGRSIVGSGANLSTFSLMKEYLVVERKWNDGALLDMVAGLSSGAVSVIFMNPIDVIRTRYYNQSYTNGKGASYTSGIDAFQKIITNEGPKAFYKGFFSHFLRIGPHFCLTFMFLGILRRSTNDYYKYLDQSDAFQSFDLDGDGKLSKREVTKALEKVFGSNVDGKELKEYTREIMENKTEIDFHEYQNGMEKRIKELYLRKL